MTAAEIPRGSDEAVRRIREESRRRIEQRRGWRAFSSLCALATLAGGISLAAMNAREARLQQQAEDAAAEASRAHEAAVAEAASARDREHQELCAKLFAGTQRLRWTLAAQLRAASDEKQLARIWAEMGARHAPLASAQAAVGCPVTPLEPEDRPRCRCGDC
jgi:predicted lipid-binding transport protein (Tim44 family)